MQHGAASTPKCYGPKYFKTNFQIPEMGYIVGFMNMRLKHLPFPFSINVLLFFSLIIETNSEVGIGNDLQFN